MQHALADLALSIDALGLKVVLRSCSGMQRHLRRPVAWAGRYPGSRDASFSCFCSVWTGFSSTLHSPLRLVAGDMPKLLTL